MRYTNQLKSDGVTHTVHVKGKLYFYLCKTCIRSHAVSAFSFLKCVHYCLLHMALLRHVVPLFLFIRNFLFFSEGRPIFFQGQPFCLDEVILRWGNVFSIKLSTTCMTVPITCLAVVSCFLAGCFCSQIYMEYETNIFLALYT
jgi:hypothetical protein